MPKFVVLPLRLVRGSMEYLSINPARLLSGDRFDVTIDARLVSDDREIRVAAKITRQPRKSSQITKLMKDLHAKSTRLSRSPHWLPLIAVGSCDLHGHLVLVMPTLRNGNIEEFLTIRPDADRRKLLSQVARGLEFLHNELLLAHGSLKPQNVLITDDGDAQISDLGLNHGLAPPSLAEEHYHTPSVSKVVYTAPEVFLNDVKPWESPACDVYAFGMLFLQVYAGDLIFPKKVGSGVQLMLLVVRNKHWVPPRPQDNSPATHLGFSDADWNLCASCWNLDPQQRPTMTEIS